MSKDTKKKIKGSKIPKTLKTGDKQNAKRRISKTRQARMREEEIKSTLKFGVKLVLILAVVIGCAQLFFYGKNVVANRSNGPAAWIEAKSSGTENEQPDSSGLSQTKESGAVPEPSQPDMEKSRQQTPETIAETIAETIVPFAQSSDGPGDVVQAAPPSKEASLFKEASLGPAGDGNELFPVSGPVDASKPMIAFTFDDGPYYSVDKRILDTLQAYGGRATFFIVGSRVNDYKDTLKRIHDSGSEIGNHTYNHKNLEQIPPEEVASQIEMTNDAVEAVTGFRPKLVRVPYGAFKGQVPGLVSYPMIQWNIDTQDWSSKDKDAIAASVLSQAKDGSIILMHDLYSSTAEAFETVIPLLAAQGYQFVTVSEMYAAKGMPLEAGQVYFNIPKR